MPYQSKEDKTRRQNKRRAEQKENERPSFGPKKNSGVKDIPLEDEKKDKARVLNNERQKRHRERQRIEKENKDEDRETRPHPRSKSRVSINPIEEIVDISPRPMFTLANLLRSIPASTASSQATTSRPGSLTISDVSTPRSTAPSSPDRLPASNPSTALSTSNRCPTKLNTKWLKDKFLIDCPNLNSFFSP
jgi:hypothetical protein